VTAVPSEPPVVVIYGGTGFFGGLLVRDLLDNTNARIIMVGRNHPRQGAINSRLTFTCSDMNDPSAVESALAGAFVVVHCAGPYQSLPLNPLRGAINSRVHYVDLAEDREFVRHVQEYDEPARHADIAVMTGLSVVPGLSALLAQALTRNFDKLHSVRTFVAPGTRGSRGSGTVHTLLAAAGRPMRVWRDGRNVLLQGWSEPEWIEYPPPVGWRLEYLPMETADAELLPRYFKVESAEFKAGSDFATLNRLLAVGAWLHAHTGFPPLERLSNAMRHALLILGRFGTDRGGVVVEVTGTRNGMPIQQQIAVVAEQHGERIPAIPAAIAVAELLQGKITDRGVIPLHTWLTPSRLFEELLRRRLHLWWKPAKNSNWEKWSAKELE
jgi:saccharopine dehydrogenase-like NADP-dependent oxidoreductase